MLSIIQPRPIIRHADVQLILNQVDGNIDPSALLPLVSDGVKSVTQTVGDHRGEEAGNRIWGIFRTFQLLETRLCRKVLNSTQPNTPFSTFGPSGGKTSDTFLVDSRKTKKQKT